MEKNFNIIISGVGGQGLITLTRVISEAAMIEGYDVKGSELHGLSQRGGSIGTHIRFGKKVYSPLINSGEADLILGMEMTEALRNLNFANAKTSLLIDEHQEFYLGGLTKAQVIKKIKALKNDVHLIPASEICKRELGKEIVSGIYLIGYAVQNNLIPLKSSSVLKAIQKVILKKHLELNEKSFNLAKN